MKKIVQTAAIILIAAMLFCFVGCPNGNTPEAPSNPSNPDSPVVTARSGIYTENGVFYINVETDKAPASGNGAW